MTTSRRCAARRAARAKLSSCATTGSGIIWTPTGGRWCCGPRSRASRSRRRRRRRTGNRTRQQRNGKETEEPGRHPPVPQAQAEIRRGALLLDHGGKPRKETPLGGDYGLAIQKWAALERAASIPADAKLTFRQAAERYRVEVIPTKSEGTQRNNNRELESLIQLFDDPPGPLDAIRPTHVSNYLQWRRSAPVAANREKSLLSHL